MKKLDRKARSWILAVLFQRLARVPSEKEIYWAAEEYEKYGTIVGAAV